MAELRQAEVWWADLEQPSGRRPVLILTRTAALPHLHRVTVAPFTRTIRGIPTEVAVSPAEGMPVLSVASLDNITTIPQGILLTRITTLTEQKMSEVFRALRAAFNM